MIVPKIVHLRYDGDGDGHHEALPRGDVQSLRLGGCAHAGCLRKSCSLGWLRPIISSAKKITVLYYGALESSTISIVFAISHNLFKTT